MRIRTSAAIVASAILTFAVAPAAAQEPSGRNSQAQIEIVADSLVVEQDQQLAIFTGNVDAVQGTLKLRSDILRVLYGEDEAQTGEAGAPEASSTGERPAGGQQIRRLEASGNVFITQPGESARGDRGVYEVPAGLMTLEGDVVLTRGDNVVRGARLDTDLNTGVSKVTAAAPGGRPEQRVRSLFVPAQQADEPPAPPGQPADGQPGRSAPGQAPQGRPQAAPTPTPAPRQGS